MEATPPSARFSRLQLVLVAVVFLLAVTSAAYGAFTYLTDILVLRGEPIQSFVSPNGRWEVRVYQEDPGSWLATVRATSGNAGRERVIWRGSEAAFSWPEPQVVSVLERLQLRVEEQRIDVVAARSLRPWDGRGPLARLFAVLPALILLVGLPVVVLLPAFLRERGE